MLAALRERRRASNPNLGRQTLVQLVRNYEVAADGLPVAVNLGCHSMRRATVSLTDS